MDKSASKLKRIRIVKIVFPIILIAALIFILIPSGKKSINWKPYSSEDISTSKNDNKAVIIDFYADWCIPCKALDDSTFSNKKVIVEAKKFNTYKADMTKTFSPEVEKLKDQYNIAVLPTVLIIDSKGNEAKRITGFVSANEFYKIIKNIN